MKNLISLIQGLAVRFSQETVAVRRHLHKHPELSFSEFQSSQFIASKLGEYGIPWQKVDEGTGLIAHIQGEKPVASAATGTTGVAGVASGRTRALRADMDALPITEENNVEYKSQNPGVMHACGHDAHCAILLAAARILKELAGQFSGTIQLIFQPAEERCPGGAIGMIDRGVLNGVDTILGEHVNPMLPVGTVGFRSGTMMASADEIYMQVHGKGGHAAMPHTVVDPVLIASHIIVALQQIVSRQTRPDQPSVLSFGKVNAPGAMNVIPDTVDIAGTFRTLDEEWREQALENISGMASLIAQGMGGSCETKIVRGYPALINDDHVTAHAREAAISYLGAENVVDLPLLMWSEDFSYYNQKIPGCFYNLGVGNAEIGLKYSLHTPTLMIDETALEIGSGLMAWMAICNM